LEGEETLQSNEHTSIYAIMAFNLSIPQLNGNALDLALVVGKVCSSSALMAPASLAYALYLPPHGEAPMNISAASGLVSF
jgi:hypothetical protein